MNLPSFLIFVFVEAVVCTLAGAVYGYGQGNERMKGRGLK